MAGAWVPALPLPFVDPPTDDSADDGDGDGGVDWQVARDVLRRRTSCSDDHGSEYDVDGGSVAERYTGRVEVDTRTWQQRAWSTAEFTLSWPEAAVRARAQVTLVASHHVRPADRARHLARRRAVREPHLGAGDPAGPGLTAR